MLVRWGIAPAEDFPVPEVRREAVRNNGIEEAAYGSATLPVSEHGVGLGQGLHAVLVLSVSGALAPLHRDQGRGQQEGAQHRVQHRRNDRHVLALGRGRLRLHRLHRGELAAHICHHLYITYRIAEAPLPHIYIHTHTHTPPSITYIPRSPKTRPRPCISRRRRRRPRTTLTSSSSPEGSMPRTSTCD